MSMGRFWLKKGVVVRDEAGQCLVALARHFEHAQSAIFTEAEAVKAGLLAAIHQQWQDIELECDNAMVYPGSYYKGRGRLV